MNIRKFAIPRREGKSWLEDAEHALRAKTLGASDVGGGLVFFDEKPRLLDWDAAKRASDRLGVSVYQGPLRPDTWSWLVRDDEYRIPSDEREKE